MVCSNPFRFIYNESYHKPSQKKLDGMLFPCGKCIACRQRKRSEWTTRLLMEAVDYGENNCCFITLTFSDNGFSLRRSKYGIIQGVVSVVDMQLFQKRLKAQLKRKIGISEVRYFGCGEYGSKSMRAHYHYILFGVPLNSLTQKIIQDCWEFGHVHFGAFSQKSAAYVCGYSVKPSHNSQYLRSAGLDPEKQTHSKGLGRGFISRLLSHCSSSNVDVPLWFRFQGKFRKIPNYIRNKLRELVYTPDYIAKLKTALFQESRQKLIESVRSLGYKSDIDDLTRDLISYYLLSVRSRLNLIKQKYFSSLRKRLLL